MSSGTEANPLVGFGDLGDEPVMVRLDRGDDGRWQSALLGIGDPFNPKFSVYVVAPGHVDAQLRASPGVAERVGGRHIVVVSSAPSRVVWLEDDGTSVEINGEPCDQDHSAAIRDLISSSERITVRSFLDLETGFDFDETLQRWVALRR